MAEKADIIATIRSTINSTKEKCSIYALNKDFRMLMGVDIPYQAFGFTKLIDFLKSSDRLIVKDEDGQVYVEALADDKSQHISTLVNKQKNSKRKPARPNFSDQRYGNRSVKQHKQLWQPSGPRRRYQNRGNNRSRYQSRQNENHSSYNARQYRQPEYQPSYSRRTQSPASPASPASPVEDIADPEAFGSSSTSSSEMPLVSRILRPRPESRGDGNIFLTAVDTGIDNRPRMRFQLASNPPATFENPLSTNLIRPPRKALLPTPAADQRQSFSSESVSSSEAYGPTTSTYWQPPTDKQISSRQKLIQDGDCKNQTVNELRAFVTKYALGDLEIKVAQRKAGKMILYDCKVKVGQYSFSSYPQDFRSPEDAKTAATKIALENLTRNFEKRLDTQQKVISTERDVLRRLPPIIGMYYHGIWAAQIALDYEQDRDEILPQNWLQLLDTLPYISVEKSIDDKYVLRSSKYGSKGRGNLSYGVGTEITIPMNSVRLTVDHPVYVQVISMFSANEVWCRQIILDQQDYYEDTCFVEMENIYNTGKEPLATLVSIGSFYVVRYEDSWSRVRATKFSDDNETVLCFFLDLGHEHWIKRNNIYKFHKALAKYEPQVFLCRLAGIEALASLSFTHEHIVQLYNDIYFCYLAKNNKREEEDATVAPRSSVILFDPWVHEHEENPTSMNQLIIKNILDSAHPKLCVSTINRVHISYACDDGTLYVQPHLEGYEFLLDLLENVDKNFDSYVRNASEEPDSLTESDDLYFTKYFEDDRYYRCKILDMSPDKKYAQVLFVDYGNKQIIKLEEHSLYPIADFDEVLAGFPYLALEVKIDLEQNKRPENFVAKITELLPIDEAALLKVVRIEDGDTYCEFFKRTDDNKLFSVNLTIQIPNDSEGEEDGNNNDKTNSITTKLQRLHTVALLDDFKNKPVPSSGLLKPPPLPDINGVLEISIPCAVSPWNFFVQPYKMRMRLRKLMTDLQFLYENETFKPLNLGEIIPGKIYACKYDDKYYYRTSVIKVIHSGSISVYIADFGIYTNVKITQLKPLDDKYLEMPFQAIKAKLAGVCPSNLKWTMDDCRLFEEMVLHRQFVAILKEVQNDELYKSDIVLVLEIFDTQDQQDKSINTVLIEKGAAVPEGQVADLRISLDLNNENRTVQINRFITMNR